MPRLKGYLRYDDTVELFWSDKSYMNASAVSYGSAASSYPSLLPFLNLLPPEV
jgi:hypothetical protein